MPNGTPEEEAMAARRPLGPVEPEPIRRDLEARGFVYYPIGGEDLLEEIRKAPQEQIPEVGGRFLAVKEGLVFGPDYYNLNDPHQLLWLYNLFTTVESSQERPTDLYYPEIEINKKLYEPVRGIKAKAREEGRPNLTEEEDERIAFFVRLDTHRKARGLIDAAFFQRMAACEKAEAAVALLEKDPNYRPSVKPDKGHWMAFFSGEFGEGVDKVLRRIVAAATSWEELEKIKKERGERFPGELESVERIKPTIYAEGFKTTENFRIWLSDLLKTANGRMDIVWAAWRVALTWEIPAQLGISTEKGEIKIADPPIGNDLMGWTVDIDKKRMMEWGWDADGRRIRDSKYLTHTGYPLSLGKIHEICQSYLHEASVQLKDGKKATLWQIWWEKGISLADHDKFPWAETDLQPPGLDTEEIPPASFGGWFLKRLRAHAVVGDIRSRPSLSGRDSLSDPDFFGSRLRNWEKVLGEVKPDLPPEKNPRTWWVAGLIMAHHLAADNKIPLVKEARDELAYRSYIPGEVWSPVEKGMPGSRTPSIWEVLNHAYQCGFLRKKDIDWLVKNLSLPKAPLGASPY